MEEAGIAAYVKLSKFGRLMNFHTSNNEKEGVSNISQFDTPPGGVGTGICMVIASR